MIVAAGRGERFGTDVPKQFVSVAGRPLVLWTVDAFRRHAAIAGVTLVVPAEVKQRPPEWLVTLEREGVRVVAGGAERSESVHLGLASVPADADVVAVHDGARPLVADATISRVLAAVEPGGGGGGGRERGRGAIAARRASDSLKQVDEQGRIERSLSREGVWRAETPQAFPRALIQEVHRRAAAEGVSASDCAGLCERYGVEVVVVECTEPNPKVTQPADLELVEQWIQKARTPADKRTRSD